MLIRSKPLEAALRIGIRNFSHRGYETKTGVSIMRCKNDQPKAKSMKDG